MANKCALCVRYDALGEDAEGSLGGQAKTFMEKKPVSYSKARAYDTGGDVKQMSKGGKTKSKVNEAGNYTKPTMRKNLFNRIKAGGKGGSPGQWSGRKAQMLAKAYKKAGGGYRG